VAVAEQTPESTWRTLGRRCLGAGFFLSATIMMPAVSDSGYSLGAWVVNAVLFLFVASPFLLLSVFYRYTSNPKLVVTSAAPYLACHLFLAASYLFGDARPHEFGDLGLFLVPFFESIVALPAVVVIETAIKIRERRKGI